MAENILAIRKAEYIQGKYKIKNNKKGELTFLEYYEQLKEDRFETKANYGNWDAALKHIEKYCPAHKQLKDIDTDFVKGFKRYLNTKAKTKSGTPLSQNSKTPITINLKLPYEKPIPKTIWKKMYCGQLKVLSRANLQENILPILNYRH